MNKEKPKKEFSKKIFNLVLSLFIFVILYSMILMWKTNSTDGLMYLIPSASGLAVTATGFYFWKAKMENMIKLTKENNMSIYEVKEIEENMDDFNVETESEEY